MFGFKKRLSQQDRHLKETFPYDPGKQYPIFMCSICTGEKVAGFKNKEDGRFTEVMLIHSAKEEQHFKELYELEDVKIEY